MMVNIDKDWSENLRPKMDDEKYQPAAGGGRLFEIRLKGHLSNYWSDWLESIEVKLLESGKKED
jgi:hypothetical protein